MARAIVHIGTHKTGSSSFQEWLELGRSELEAETNFLLYEGLFGSNHYEFGLLCARTTSNGIGEREFPDWCVSEWREEAAEHVRAQAARAVEHGRDLLVTSEVISLLRDQDEIERLQQLLHPLEVSIVVVLRDPSEFLSSYRTQIGPGRWSGYRESAGYTEPDSWLVDYEGLTQAFRSVFGDDQVLTVDYESSVEDFGSIIPAVALAAGLIPEMLSPWQDLEWANQRKEHRYDVAATGADGDVLSAYSALSREVDSKAEENDALTTQIAMARAAEQTARQAAKQAAAERLDLMRELDELRGAMELVTTEHEAIRGSLSWRLTRPLRRLRALIRS